MLCTKCNHKNFVKNGLMNGHQRYKCKECGYNFTKRKKTKYPFKIKREAIILYLQGIGIRQIGSKLDISHVTILKWVKKASDIMRKRLSGNYFIYNALLDQILASYIRENGIDIDNGSWMKLIPEDYHGIIPELLHGNMSNL